MVRQRFQEHGVNLARPIRQNLLDLLSRRYPKLFLPEYLAPKYLILLVAGEGLEPPTPGL
jgi:hypothetical protein